MRRFRIHLSYLRMADMFLLYDKSLRVETETSVGHTRRMAWHGKHADHYI